MLQQGRELCEIFRSKAGSADCAEVADLGGSPVTHERGLRSREVDILEDEGVQVAEPAVGRPKIDFATFDVEQTDLGRAQCRVLGGPCGTREADGGHRKELAVLEEYVKSLDI